MSLDNAIRKAIGVKLQKVATGVTSGDVGDFVPVAYADEFIDLIRERNYLRQLFPVINMPAKTLNIPRLDTDATVYYISDELTAPTAQSEPAFAAGGSVQLVAKKLMAYVDVSNDVEENSKIALLPIVKRSFAEAMAKAEEENMLVGNGLKDDGAGTIGAAWTFAVAQDRRKALNGFASIAAPAIRTYATGWTETVNLARYALGVYGRDVRDLVLFVNTYGGATLRYEDELKTVDKYGPNATVLTGELGKFFGITAIEHPYLPLDATQAAIANIYTHAANKGNAFLMKKDAGVIGDMRKVKFAQDEIVATDAVRVVISERLAFAIPRAAAICRIMGTP